MNLFRMPSLGSDMESATLTEWLVKPGDSVQRGDLVAVVETEKGAIEIEIFVTGRMGAYLAELGAEVLVGEPLAEIDSAEEAGVDQTLTPTPVAHAQRTSQIPLDAEPVPVVPTVTSVSAAQRVSPAARQLAAQKQLDPTTIEGSGPQGAVVFADVQRVLAAKPQGRAMQPHDSVPGAMRRTIAAAMTRSKREIPHYYLSHRVDFENASQWLAVANAQRASSERLLPIALLLKATAMALNEFPEFNGFYEADVYRASERVHLGVAIAVRGGGLVAPALHDVNELSIETLMVRLRDLTGRVRAGRFRAAELRDPTITVSSLGDRGVHTVYGVIYPPQVACIGFGKISLTPWSLNDGSVESHRTVVVTLSADHRVSDGHRGALLISRIDALLQDPGEL